MDKLLDKIIENMKKNDSLTDDEEIVRFGLEIMIEKAIFIVIIVAFGLLMRCFFESAVFTVCFTLLREYGGGYHAETKRKCFVLSILTLIVALGSIKLAEHFTVLVFPLFITAFISVIYIFIAAPIDTPNKRFDKDEIKVYGKKARIFTAVLSAAAVVLWLLKLDNFAVAAAVGIIIEAYLMLKGYIKNHMEANL